jgi:tetratricopeptide (TPR) repeat protein
MTNIKTLKLAIIIIVWLSVIGYLFMISSSITDNVSEIKKSISKPNIEKILVKDTAKSSLSEWKEEWKAQLELRDANFEVYQHGLENDISTLEIMLTVLALVIGFFAYLGVSNIKETKDAIERTEDKSRKINDEIETIKTKLQEEFKEANDVKNKILDIRKSVQEDHNKMISTVQEIEFFKTSIMRDSSTEKHKKEKLKKEVYDNVEQHKHPSFYLPALHYLYESELITISIYDAKDTDLFIKGLYYYASENYDEAIKCYSEVNVKNKNFKNVNYYLALAYDDFPNYEKAIEYYKQCEVTNTDNFLKSISLSNLAFTLVEKARRCNEKEEALKLYNEAQDYFNKHIGNNGEGQSDPVAHLGIAIINKEIDNIEVAEEFYTKSESLSNHSHKWEVLYSKKQYERMLEASYSYFKLKAISEKFK